MSAAPITPSQEDLEGPRGFLHFLERIGYGRAMQNLSEANHELGVALKQAWFDQKKGVKAKLKITISYAVDPEDGSVSIDLDYDVKKPKRLKPGCGMFITKGGNFTLDNPRQVELQLGPRAVSIPARDEARSIDPQTGEVR